MLKHEDCVADMAAAAPNCATLRAARLLLLHVAVAVGMVPMGGARVMDAPPLHDKGSSIALHTAAGRRTSRAPWRAGLCVKHGGGKDECLIAGCTNQSYGFLKTCQKHGGSGYCQHPSGCIAPATKYGANCRKHTKKEKKD